jgi:hypothetical protein
MVYKRGWCIKMKNTNNLLIFALVVIIVVFVANMIYKFIKKRQYLKDVKEISKNNMSMRYSEDTIESYSREISEKIGFRNCIVNKSLFKRPLVLQRRISHVLYIQNQKSRMSSHLYRKAMKRLVTLRGFAMMDDCKNISVSVYVDSMNGKKVVVRDASGICEIELDGIYFMVGNFVLINMDKDNKKVKVNYILMDN